jgi:hypothetical protein
MVVDLQASDPVDKRETVEMLKAPIIQMGRDCGFEVTDNYDLGAGPVHVVWTFKPGSESLPDLRLGFMCLTGYSESALNEALARGMLNLMDKLVLVVPSESMTRHIKDSIELMPDKSILQLRKYLTVLTPSTLISKAGILRDRDESIPTSEAA